MRRFVRINVRMVKRPVAMRWQAVGLFCVLSFVTTSVDATEATETTDARHTVATDPSGAASNASREGAHSDGLTPEKPGARSPAGPDAQDAPLLVRDVRFRGLSNRSLTAADLLRTEISLRRTDGVWSAADGAPAAEEHRAVVTRFTLRAIRDATEPVPVDASALRALAAAVHQRFAEARIGAVRIDIPSDALERLGPEGDGVLTLLVTEGRIEQVRVFEREAERRVRRTGAWNARVVEQSPLGAGDVIRLDAASRYVHWLNRRPHRRVDLALSRGEGDGLMLDYLIHQTKPWTVYVQASNTGTESTTEWRQRVGFAHHDLTGVDDALALDYITGNFDEVNAFTGSYERPLPGAPRWRTRVSGVWSAFDSSTVGLGGLEFTGESSAVGGALTWQFFQKDRLFLDLFAELRYEQQSVDNETLGVSGQTDFLLPSFGVRAERRGDHSFHAARIAWQSNLSGLVGTDAAQLQRLGRTDADTSWQVAQASTTHVFYLEPLLDPRWGQPDHAATLAHEVFLTLRGQWVPGDRRLPPAYTRTIGGFHTVRGYPESFTAADNLFAATFEYRLHLPRLFAPGEPVDLLGQPFHVRPDRPLGRVDWDLIGRAFVDVGRVVHNDRLNFEDNLTLAGAGVGIELVLKRNLNLRADWAFALQDEENGTESVDAGSSEVHLVFTVSY